MLGPAGCACAAACVFACSAVKSCVSWLCGRWVLAASARACVPCHYVSLSLFGDYAHTPLSPFPLPLHLPVPSHTLSHRTRSPTAISWSRCCCSTWCRCLHRRTATCGGSPLAQLPACLLLVAFPTQRLRLAVWLSRLPVRLRLWLWASSAAYGSTTLKPLALWRLF